MFDDEEEDFADNSLNEDLEVFEAHLKGKTLGFMDSDRLEGVIDHYLINNQYAKARAAAELGIYHFNYNPLFQLRKAQALSGIGLINEALDILTHLEKSNHTSAELLLTKASLFSQLRDSKNAIKYFKLAITLCEEEDRDEIYLDIALEYQNLAQYKDAIDILTKALKVNPQNEGALYEIAFCYDQLGDYNQAIKSYSSFIDENPYSYTAWYNLGNAYSKAEKHEKAIWAYDYSLLINNEFGPAHFNLGNAYLTTEKYHKAIEHFSECMRLDGDDAMALCYIGEAHEQLEELDLAKHYYKRSLEMAPMLPEAWLGLGIVEDMEGNTREGIIMFHKALDFDPDNAGIHHVLAGAYEKLDEFELAIEHYEESLLLDSSDVECLSDYIELMTEINPILAFEKLTWFNTETGGTNMAKILEVNLRWLLGQRENALRLFINCLQEDKKLAQTLFEINPRLLDDPDFVSIAD